MIFNFVKRFFVVRRCFICGKIIKQPYEENSNTTKYACKSCINNLAFTSFAPILTFSAIRNGKAYFSKAIAPFHYVSSIKSAILRFKFKNQKSLAPFFARYMYMAMNANYFYKNFDCIIAVPISSKKLSERGYNQSNVLAEEINLMLDISILNDVVYKVIENVTQSNIQSTKDRILNVANVYKIENKDKILNKKILLIDDVITTGATVNEISKLLIDLGAKEVLILAIANANYSKRRENKK